MRTAEARTLPAAPAGDKLLLSTGHRKARQAQRTLGALLAAAVFLFSPTTQLAAISVLLLEDGGATNEAAAFSCSIMAIIVGTLLAAHLLLRLLGARNVSPIR
jgi:hypothetical protein